MALIKHYNSIADKYLPIRELLMGCFVGEIKIQVIDRFY